MDELDALVRAILSAPKYHMVSEDVVRAVGQRELARRTTWKEALKTSKRKLHQIGAAYLDGRPEYDRWLAEMSAAAHEGDRACLLDLCKQAMAQHASTRERLPLLGTFFARTLGSLPGIRSVIDVACGLNPLAIPWMPLDPQVRYDAYDIYVDMVEFLNGFLRIVGVSGQARAQDVTQSPPEQRADLALLLKSMPCIDQLEESAAACLLDALRVEHALVSFPVRSLGGRHKGMAHNYERAFRELVAARTWSVERFDFGSELAFLIHK